MAQKMQINGRHQTTEAQKTTRGIISTKQTLPQAMFIFKPLQIEDQKKILKGS